MLPVRVSCVIATHLRPTLLRYALATVAGQSRRPDEVLVVDDVGPTGHRPTIEAVKAAAAAGLAVRHVPNPAGTGASSSRNLGAAVATGDVLAFLDDDDLWSPAYLQTALTVLRVGAHDAVVTWITRFRVVGGATRDGGHVEVRDGRRVAEGLVASDVVARNPGVTGSNLVVTRPCFDAIGGFDECLPVSNDKDLFWRLLRHGARYAVVTRPLVYQRHHDDRRLTRSGARLAAGLQQYLDTHARHCSPGDRRHLRWMVTRARYNAARGPAKLVHAARGVWLVGPRALWRETQAWTPVPAETLPSPVAAVTDRGETGR